MSLSATSGRKGVQRRNEIMTKKLVIMGLVMIMVLCLFGGCNPDKIIEEEAMDMVDCSLFRYSDSMDWTGEPITLYYDDDSATIECSVEVGCLLLTGPVYSKKATLKPGHGFYWQKNVSDEIEQAYIDLVWKMGEHIVGYAVVEIYHDTAVTAYVYRARRIKCVSYPKIDGEYQSITQEQIDIAIEQAKQKII